MKELAHNLAKAVMQFWHSAEVTLNSGDLTVSPENCKSGLVGKASEEVSKDKNDESNMLLVFFWTCFNGCLLLQSI